MGRHNDNNDPSQSIRKIGSYGRKPSLQKQAEAAQQQLLNFSRAPTITTVKDSVSGYDLDWKDLKEVLVFLFPSHPQELFVENVSSDIHMLKFIEMCSIPFGS